VVSVVALLTLVHVESPYTDHYGPDGRRGRSVPQAILTLETLQVFVFDFRETAGTRQLQKTLRTGFLLFRFGHHSWNPVEEVDGNVVEGHGRKASEPVAASQDILAQYGVALRFLTDLPTFL
jgi:hypothetical protein